MAFADEDKNSEYEKNIEPAEVKLHRQLAEYYHLPFINLSKEVYERIKHKEFSWKEDFKNLHPSPFGQNIYFQTIKTMLQLCEKEYHAESIAKVKLQKPQFEGVYDNGIYVDVYQANKLNGFSVTDQWKPSDQKLTREGFVNVPILESAQPRSSFSLSFKGNAIGIAIVAGPDAGIIEYRVDKGKLVELNLYTKWSNSLHLPWYVILADGLTKGRHKLEIKISSAKGNSGGNACRIVHFLVNK
jgi:sialidase-1